MDEWKLDGWVGGWESGFKDCLQQSKINKSKREVHMGYSLHTVLPPVLDVLENLKF